ncbi:MULTISPECIES: DUF5318 domain-containing protein [unclassified Corynebacterium]|uniref:DUF5318 domain-containing protein n=1 Tax=unclassified Corynebacterium TaxID=2624378 RepID=UPI0021A9E6E1|nr:MULTISPECIES: DUF5318 domain-containing protein [unclassified Corynebacterium]MCT1451841.1 DUF5318 domain-containing protein [Corynebacterium sp. p3-SID1145]MCT1460938.1 DUF5318 domain-containing protein [Corynebacterium sp. p3-SID1140]MDN8594224.1 DUF5318 domain-containing protein [Corynebacterium sp. P4_F2]WKK55226.1 DUF5318 domain-containing protein [Corynebacterium sp. P4-C1]WKK62636.1 DUF5318 domain-containing protein [Corynebacterium sp. P8-C1]
MFQQIHSVSHEWERRAALREFRAGKKSREEVCDADFLLRAAAEHHGVDSGRDCPICGTPMRNVFWVYGDNLGRRSGSARGGQEIAELIDEVGPFTVHTVEVCGFCRWNHLLLTAEAVPVQSFSAGGSTLSRGIE